MKNQVAQGASLYKRYTISEVTGSVASAEAWTETETTGSVSGGGGLTVGGTGGAAPVTGRVETKVTRYQSLMLKSEDGKAHPFKMKNFQVECIPNQTLSVFTLGSDDEAPVIHVYNHDTERHYKNDSALNWAMYPFLVLFAVLAAIVFMVWNWASGNSSDGFITFAKTFVISGFIGLFVYGLGHIFAMVRSSRAMRHLKHGFPNYPEVRGALFFGKKLLRNARLYYSRALATPLSFRVWRVLTRRIFVECLHDPCRL